MSIVIVASHKGPYVSLAPLERVLGPRASFALEMTAADERRRQKKPFSGISTLLGRNRGWERALKALGAKAVVRGTSELPEAKNNEALAAKAAVKLGLPVYAVEDFPGNYRGKPILKGLFVEFESVKPRWADSGMPVHAVGNARYSELSRQVRRGAPRASAGPVVLWAGQPDGETCARTIECLIPALKKLNATLLFRAHPRDENYRGPKRLQEQFPGLPIVDLTNGADPLSDAGSAELVITQFSTLAVEAAALGVPALFALLPGSGREYLKSRTGLESLPWCEQGAAFLLDDPAKTDAVLKEALFDRDKRKAAITRMAELRRDGAQAPERIARHLVH